MNVRYDNPLILFIMNEKQFTRTDIINALLLSFRISYYDFREIRGATVTLYKFRPKIGTKISKIRNLKDELAAALRVSSVRIIAPMEDGSVGIEVPNAEREVIPAASLFKSWEYQNADMELPCAIGKTVDNEVFVADLADMPHLLVAGATGQGKSVGLNVILMSLLTKKTPDELRLVLIDPKKVELGIFSELGKSYLATPVITEVFEAEQKLKAICDIMDERYNLLSSVSVRNIKEYNALDIVEHLPYIVVVIDEYGDLVMQAGKRMETYICRIAQKARAVGIHMIVSTQRPSATIVTGNIKANFPTRIAFRTTTGTDSRVILDQVGAEKLTGKGDMIYFSGSETTRMQCAYASIDDVQQLCKKLKERYADYDSAYLLPEIRTLQMNPQDPYALPEPELTEEQKEAVRAYRKEHPWKTAFSDELIWRRFASKPQEPKIAYWWEGMEEGSKLAFIP
jgi:DNA segregation ATPase FtsK/SpoIIIE, S-DNA-T family